MKSQEMQNKKFDGLLQTTRYATTQANNVTKIYKWLLNSICLYCIIINSWSLTEFI